MNKIEGERKRGDSKVLFLIHFTPPLYVEPFGENKALERLRQAPTSTHMHHLHCVHVNLTLAGASVAQQTLFHQGVIEQHRRLGCHNDNIAPAKSAKWQWAHRHSARRGRDALISEQSMRPLPGNHKPQWLTATNQSLLTPAWTS